MILLWLKIMYFKIAKELKRSWSVWCRISAEAGTEPRAHARATDTEPLIGGLPDGIVLYSKQPGTSEITSKRLQDLIDKGIVSVPLPGTDDFTRVAMFEQDRRDREEAAGHDPSRCPCGGRHYPSADACRWCACHDPRSEHHLSQEQTEALRHDMSVPPVPTHPVAEIIRNSYRPCSLCGDSKHARDRHNQTVGDRVGDLPMGESAVRPSKEIELCPACHHPQHPLGNGLCAISVPSRMQDGGFHPCGCIQRLANEGDGHA